MFESVLAAYKNMNIFDKKDVVIKELKKTIEVLKKICNDKGINYREIESKEVLELSNDNGFDDDYLDQMFIYVMYLEELLWSYIDYTDKN